MSDNNEAVFLASGTKLNGRFVIERVIGQGGFGITYYARHEILDHAYAIKEFYISGHCSRNTSQHTVILQGMSDDMYEKYKQRFLEEAKTVLSLDHPNIVKVVDVFEENNTAYMVMPFIEGISLQKMVENNHGPLPYELTVNYMGQLSDAVAYIHSKHILHRDIKPDNVLITPDNKVMLIDFGSAREFVNDKTQRHTSILTQGYAPLEQYNSVSRKGNYTDIYALGGVYYFCLTGTTPVDATARLLETGTGDDPLKQPKDLNPNVTESVNRTIMKAMELRPENRHQTVKEFQDDLLGRNDAKEIVDDAKEMPMKSVTETQTEKPSASPKQVKENVEDISVTNSTVEKKTKTAIADNKKPETPKKKKGKAWWVILIIMILGGAGYAIWQHQENLRMQELDMYYSCYDANSCRRYLKSYPDGRYRYEVQSSLDNFVSDSIAKVKAREAEEALFRTCNTLDACNYYLQQYPNGRFVDQVNTKIIDLKTFSVTTKESGNKVIYVNGVPFEMVYVQGGTFMMGATSEQGSDASDDEKPAHYVTLSDYYIGEFLVTQELWRAVVGSEVTYNGGWTSKHGRGDNYPVYRVDYSDITKIFLTKLNKLTGLKFRLPTEAEWEFAARGGVKSKGYKYSGSNNIEDVAWYEFNSGNKRFNGNEYIDYDVLVDNRNKAHPVGTKMPNELGIYDMSGNLDEWCSDYATGTYTTMAQTNPKGPSISSWNDYEVYITRGGSWGTRPSGCRVSSRGWAVDGCPYNYYGFRIALSK